MHWMRTIARASITDSCEQVRTCLKFVNMSNVCQVSSLYIYFKFFNIQSH